MTCKPMIQNKVISCLIVSCGGCLTFAGINVYKGNEQFYSTILMPMTRLVTSAETAHKIAIKMSKHGFVPTLNYNSSLLRTTLWGLNFENPIGLAAGFDKDGEAFVGLSKMGFGFIEIGTVTPEPQPGNEKPRVFRLPQDLAIINRYGFNSAGYCAVKSNVELYGNSKGNLILGLNLGKNKWSKDAANDYAKGILQFSDCDCVDYYVINISSPNTPNLRDLQNKRELNQLIEEILKIKNENNINKPLLVKISPDLDDNQINDITAVVNKFASNKSKRGIDGLIICNTTVSRPDDLNSNIKESGGLSGVPLKQQSTQLIKKIYKLTSGKIAIIGVGGISDGKDAYEKFKAGASLVQIYTVLTYEGPPVVDKIKRELTLLLKSEGLNNISEAIGLDHR